MEKRSLSSDVQERYLDATVAAFMEEYVSAMDTGAEQNNGEFPQELDERCRKIIEKARKQRRRNQILRGCMRVCRSAAVLALVLMCVGTTLFFTVESFRLPVMNLVLERTDKYTNIRLPQVQTGSEKVGVDMDPNDPLRLVLYEEFDLVEINNQWDQGMLYAKYENPDATVVFFVEGAYGVLQIDTEDAVINRPLVMGREVITVVKGNKVSVIWTDEQQHSIFELHTTGLSEVEAAEICADTIILFEGE